MRFDHVGVLVHDLEAAKTFARDVLGLGDPVAEFEAPDHGLAGAFFGLGEGRLEVFTLESARDRLPADETARIDHVAVRVEDLDAERERLAEKGVEFHGPHADDARTEPVDLRGSRHLWTKKETSGGFVVQLIQPPS